MIRSQPSQKFLWLGMPLYEVIRRSTETTARIMGLEDGLGTLKVGAEGDVTILRLDEGSFTLTDSERVSVEARQKLNHVRTIKSGRGISPVAQIGSEAPDISVNSSTLSG